MAADALASPSGPRRSRAKSGDAAVAAEPAVRHRLDVLAGSVIDVVSSAGGWLADRALAGWDVNVFVPDAEDSAALRILGVNTHKFPEPNGRTRNLPHPTALAVSANALQADTRVRARLTAECERDIAEVTIWGDPEAATIDVNLSAVQHVPSGAARAFKSHALRAAAADPGDAAAEVFHTGRPVGERRRLAAVPADRSALPAAVVWAPTSRKVKA
jgi:hypothetical protein